MDEELRKVVADALRVAPERITTDLSYQAIAEWDSLRHVALMLALEDHYELRLGAADAARLASVEAIERYVHEGNALSPAEAPGNQHITKRDHARWLTRGSPP